MTARDELAQTEQERLDSFERIIQRGITAFKEVGTALAAIHDDRLYRETHATFEAYCQDRWGFTDRRARQIMDAAEIGTIVPVRNEGQARELGRVPEEDRAEIWQQANERTEGNPTAKSVRDAWQDRQEPEPEPAPESESRLPDRQDEADQAVAEFDQLTQAEQYEPPIPASLPTENQLLDAIELRKPGAKAEVARARLRSRWSKDMAGVADVPLLDADAVAAVLSDAEANVTIGTLRDAARWADRLEAARAPKLRVVGGEH